MLILAMAKYFADNKGDCDAQDIVKAGALVGIPMLMVLAQPDLGTALTYLPIAIMGLVSGRYEGETCAGDCVDRGAVGAGGMARAEALPAGPTDDVYRAGGRSRSIRVTS